MKYLIVFSSLHGTTEKAAHHICEYFKNDVELVDLYNEAPLRELEIYDVIIIGVSIHLSSIQRQVKQFLKTNLDILLTKKVGLFLCCMNEGELAKEQFNKAFPSELREHSIANGLFGGELLFSQMNFLEQQIIQKVKGISSDITNLNENSIKAFATKFL
ncbi:flavodoxin domain-containing protein [Alkalihalobacillus sp. BA299]|uniref:flavodoxin domain-containing protein n=1 Tax=Alkalihalobacillus sp. BA299 TaxID=2815938 RepID=UPI001ADBDB80|nr:flavodoxin domain-containing protein [Alkalihalobacillus sp. BA299]